VAEVGPNLDAELALFSADGTQVALNDPTASVSSNADNAPVNGLGAQIATTLEAGTYYLRVDGVGSGDVAGTGYSDYGSLGRYTFTATMNAPAQPAITTTSLTAATVGTAFSQTLGVSGGVAPYTWSVTSGTWPAGLSMSSAGVISGTPTAAGTADMTIRVADASDQADSKTLTLTVTGGGGGGGGGGGSVGEVKDSVVKRLSTASGSSGGGDTVIIKGQNLAAWNEESSAWDGGAVKFGSTAVGADSVVGLSESALKVVTPAYTEAMTKVKAQVVVTVGDATKGPKFTYVADGVWVEPNEGCEASPELAAEGGSSDTNASVSLTGAKFDAAFTSVAVGGKKLKLDGGAVTENGTRLAFSPPKKLTGFQDVVVLDKRVPTGGLYAGTCLYTGIRPTITAVSVAKVNTAEATEVTLSGTDLNRVKTATYNGEKVKVAKTTNPASLTVTVGKGAAVTPGVPIIVTTAYEESASSPVITREAGTA
jgi:hypothetical protein